MSLGLPKDFGLQGCQARLLGSAWASFWCGRGGLRCGKDIGKRSYWARSNERSLRSPIFTSAAFKWFHSAAHILIWNFPIFCTKMWRSMNNTSVCTLTKRMAGKFQLYWGVWNWYLILGTRLQPNSKKIKACCQSLWTFSNWDPHKGTLAASEEILEHVEVYRAEVVEYENTDRSWIHKYGRRIRGSESLSLSGSLIRTHTMLHKHEIMDIIQLKHSWINMTKCSFLRFYQSGVIKINR